MGITLQKELIVRIINTLKKMDVRGYESMDMLVGLVNLFENVIEKADEMAKQQDDKSEDVTVEEAE